MSNFILNGPTDSHHALGIRTMEVLEWNPHRAFRMDKLTIADEAGLWDIYFSQISQFNI